MNLTICCWATNCVASSHILRHSGSRFGSLAVGHFWKAFQSGYDTMPDNQLKQRVRWDVYLLILRVI